MPYWTNREAIEAKELPSSLIALGGGAVGPTGGEVLGALTLAVLAHVRSSGSSR